MRPVQETVLTMRGGKLCFMQHSPELSHVPRLARHPRCWYTAFAGVADTAFVLSRGHGASETDLRT